MLDDMRKNIDTIDDTIVELLEKRLNLVRNIGTIKKENKINILDTSREDQIIAKITKLVPGADRGYISNIYKAIMETSRELQSEIVEDYLVGYFGSEGSYTEEASIAYFGDNVKRIGYEDFEDVAVAIVNGDVDYGVLPIENTSTGSITKVYDLLDQYNLAITGEKLLKISHNLIGLPGAGVHTINTVYSHAQGLLQCSAYLKDKKWEKCEYSNTSKSVDHVRKMGTLTNAAIGSVRAAEKYGLKVIEFGINDNHENYTKFIVVRKMKQSGEWQGQNTGKKISMMFHLDHSCGSLYKILKHFSDFGVNLLKIESRPIKNHPFEYSFYVDIEGNLEEPRISEVIGEIKKDTIKLKIFGCY